MKTNTSLSVKSLELQIPYKSYEPKDSNKEVQGIIYQVSAQWLITIQQHNWQTQAHI